jgi:hypothetical protein
MGQDGLSHRDLIIRRIVIRRLSRHFSFFTKVLTRRPNPAFFHSEGLDRLEREEMTHDTTENAKEHDCHGVLVNTQSHA